MAPVGFEPIISASERPQTYDLDRADTGTGDWFIKYTIYKNRGQVNTFYTPETLINLMERH